MDIAKITKLEEFVKVLEAYASEESKSNLGLR